MKKNCVFGLLMLLLSCAPSSQDADFKSFIKSFHHAKWKQFPAWEARTGIKELDKILPIPTQKKHEADLQFCKKYRDSLLTFDPARLSVPFQFEYNKIKPFLTSYIHDLETLKVYENDPSYYDLRESFFQILKLENTTNENHLEILTRALQNVPEFYSAAMTNLKKPDQDKLREAMQQQIELYHLLERQIPEVFQAPNLSKSQVAALELLTFQAQLSIKDFIAFCQSAAFEHMDEALNASPNVSNKEHFEKIFTTKK